jgi:hypothetical protein
MSLFGKVKKFGKKALGEVLNNVQTAAPIADYFYPGSGQYISAGSKIVGKKTGLDDEGFFKETDKLADAVDKYVTPVSSMVSSFSGGSSMLPTPQVLGSNRVSNDPLSFDNITGAIKGIGGLADLFSGGAGGRVSDYNDQVYKANDLLTQYAYQQADKDYALAQQEYAAKQAYSAAAGAHAARAASARAAAARQEEENRLKAARQSLKIQKQGRKKADALFSPYYETGHRALALSESLFNQGASMVGDIKSLIGDSKSGTDILNSVR